MKKTFLLVPLAIILVMSLFLVSCEDEPEIKTFTVSFMDGETTAADPQTVEYGKTATAPTAPTKEGHTFNCWRKVGSSSPFDFAKEVITEDTVLEAVWDINTYTVTFDYPDGQKDVEKNVFYGGKVEIPKDPEPADEKYEFFHWTADAESKEEFKFDTTPIEDNLTLYPVFGIKKFTVTFEGDVNISSVLVPQKVAYGSYAKNPNATAIEGYIITGWTTVEGGDAPFDFTSSPIEADITLYPIVKEGWKLKFYVGEELVHTSGVELGSTFVYPDKPTKEGYDFAGWKKKDKEVYIYSSTVIDSDMELEACWNKAGLLSITNTGNVKGNTDPEVEVIIIPENINGVTPTKIADSAFKQWTNITTVVLPPTINSIGKNAFTGCTKLSQCILSDNITTIGSRAFYGCSNLSVNIPNRISSIDSFAFSGSKILEAILPETLTTMGNGVFYNCTGLTTVVLPPMIDSIGDQAFYGCTNLSQCTLSDNITAIGSQAFFGCSNLSVNIPKRITSIGFEAFRKSKILEAILPETLTTMGNNVFYECNSLTTAVIPSTITTIPMNTFNGCNILKNVTINGNITEIGANAFQYTGTYAKFITLNLPASIVAENSLIDTGAFRNLYITLNINQKESLSHLDILNNKWGATSLTIKWLPE